MRSSLWHLYSSLFIFQCLVASHELSGSIISVTKDVMQEDPSTTISLQGKLRSYPFKRIGQIRYHYYDNLHEPDTPETAPTSACSYIIVVGVGTSMTVDQYDKMAERIVSETSIVFVVSNHNVGSLDKKSAKQYADLLNAIHDQQGNLVPICKDNQHPAANIVIGGHSSSGQAAFEAVQRDLFHFEPLAFFGLDPYQISNTTSNSLPMRLPALYWGLTSTTCFVNVEKAALGFFRLTSTIADRGRVLYLIENNQSSLTHCVFTDSGCGVGPIVVCPTRSTLDWVYESVAESVHLFLDALISNKGFNKDFFELTATLSGKVLLQVNEGNLHTIERSSLRSVELA